MTKVHLHRFKKLTYHLCQLCQLLKRKLIMIIIKVVLFNKSAFKSYKTKYNKKNNLNFHFKIKMKINNNN
jgi:hypothetical protein